MTTFMMLYAPVTKTESVDKYWNSQGGKAEELAKFLHDLLTFSRETSPS